MDSIDGEPDVGCGVAGGGGGGGRVFGCWPGRSDSCILVFLYSWLFLCPFFLFYHHVFCKVPNPIPLHRSHPQSFLVALVPTWHRSTRCRHRRRRHHHHHLEMRCQPTSQNLLLPKFRFAVIIFRSKRESILIGKQSGEGNPMDTKCGCSTKNKISSVWVVPVTRNFPTKKL